MDTSQQSSQVFVDPIARMLGDVCCKISAPLVKHVPGKNIDDNLIQRLPSLSFLTDCSLQSPCQDLQSYGEIDKGDFFSV